MRISQLTEGLKGFPGNLGMLKILTVDLISSEKTQY